jgi:Ser/Thr protein kinase RdoA (MazF antagonist)
MGENFGKQRARIEHHLFNAPPRTLLHGDYHLGNLVFATQQGGIPFAVIDWQMLRRGRGVREVAYFLSENLLPENRRAVEVSLLADYHRRLVEGGVCGYTFTDCLTDYRLALLQRFRALVSTIAVMPFTDAERQMHVDVLLPRTIAAILDHDANELL